MKRIRYYFASKKLQMAQLHDLQRQWQEMRDERDILEDYYMDEWEKSNSLTDQLHRVARERDNERKLRLEAEDALLDRYLVAKSEDPDVVRDRYLENAENEEE